MKAFQSFRRTMLLLVFLLLAGATGGGVYVYCFWNKSDELLRQTILETLREMAPQWQVSVRGARFDIQGRVHLYDVSIPGIDQETPFLEMPEAILVLDRETLGDPHPVIKSLRIIRPRVQLARDPDGQWNMAQLPPLKLPRGVIPECSIEQGVLGLELRGTDHPASQMRVDGLDMQMIPSGKQQFRVKLSANCPGAERCSAEGTWNIPDRSWTVEGTLQKLRIDRPLLYRLAEFSPEFQRGLRRFETQEADRLREWASANPRSDPRTDTPIQFTGAANVDFHFSRPLPDQPWEYRLSLQLLEGEVSHPALPYNLRDLRGEIVLDAQRIEVRKLWAQSDATKIHVEQGAIVAEGELRTADFDVTITELPLDERLHRILPAENRRIYESVDPTGEIDVRMHFHADGRSPWSHEGTLTVRDCTAAHIKVPYRVEQINGKITHKNNVIDMELAGRAGPRRVTLRGRVKNPGPEAQSLILIETPGVPIDEKLRAACPEGIRSVLDQVGLQGEVEGSVRLSRAAGPDQEVIPFIKGKLKNGAVRCQVFPYALAGVTGDFQGAPGNWKFRNFYGRQGAAQVNWSGSFLAPAAESPRLELEFDGQQIPCDRTLFESLPIDWKQIWSEIRPQGLLNLSGTLDWTPGAPPHVALDAELLDGKIALRAIPYALDDVRADVGMKEGVVTIRSLSGRHDETVVHAGGWAEFFDDGEWHLHFSDLRIDDLEAGPSFRKTLPEKLRDVLEAFNPRGRVSIAGKLDFRGKKGDEYPITAAWDTRTVYTQTTITAGIDLKDMHGAARFQGTWDGEDVVGQGWIELKSVKVLGFQLADVKGPVKIDGNHLIVGSQEAMNRTAGAPVNNAQRLTAHFIEGVIGMDAEVDLGRSMTYHTRITLQDGDLKRYAQLHLPNHSRLAGAMNGWVELTGAGTDLKRLNGTGQLVISPAALYDLPLLVATLQALLLTPPKDYAFDQAQFIFNIRNSAVQFGKIDLVGDAIHLKGRGLVRFDKTVALEFFSSAGRKQLPIPILREAIKMGTNAWVGVFVSGTVKDPHTEIKPLPQLDATLRRLLGAFDGRGPERQ
ncbi:MAG: hypothetical protein ACKV0T_03065 [Planctomycetales bacterium]